MFLKFLHIAIMFTAVAVAVGGELILVRAAATRNVAAIRGTFGAAGALMRLVPFLFTAGVLVGIIAALVGAWNPLAPWLIAAYVLFVIAMGVGAQIGAWAQRVGMAAVTSPLEAPSAELTAAIDDPRARLFRYANWLILVVFIFLMVYKPGA